MNEDQTPKEDVSQSQDPALELTNIDSAIKSRITQIEKVREQLKTQKEMLTSFLENEPKYIEFSNLAKKANQQKNSIKAQLLKQPSASNLVETIKALKEQQRDVQEGLSYYLREYQRLTGANEFEGDDGELREIIYVAKLVKKSVFKK